jgi:hypothetical protein
VSGWAGLLEGRRRGSIGVMLRGCVLTALGEGDGTAAVIGLDVAAPIR